MYEAFPAQNPPSDAATVFAYLKNVLVNHLDAFERGTNRIANGGQGVGNSGAKRTTFAAVA